MRESLRRAGIWLYFGVAMSLAAWSRFVKARQRRRSRHPADVWPW